MESLVTQNVMHASLCHMISGTFQGGYSVMSIALRRVLKGARRVKYPSQQPRENTAHHRAGWAPDDLSPLK